MIAATVTIDSPEHAFARLPLSPTPALVGHVSALAAECGYELLPLSECPAEALGNGQMRVWLAPIPGAVPAKKKCKKAKAAAQERTTAAIWDAEERAVAMHTEGRCHEALWCCSWCEIEDDEL